MGSRKPFLKRNQQPEWHVERATHYCVPAPILGPRHRHPDLHQVVKILDGQGEIVIGSQRFPANAGGVFWTPANVPHASRDPVGQSPRMIDLLFRRNRASPWPFHRRRFPYHIRSDHDPAVLACLHELVKEFARRKPFWEWAASALLSHLIALLARSVEIHAILPATRIAGYRSDPAGVEKAITYIQQNYYQPIDLARLARVSGMSVSRLAKLFRALEGTTPIDYLIDFRLQRASEMMAEGRFKLVQIAEAVGFRSIHYFSRCYKQRRGVPPSSELRAGVQRSVAVNS